MGTNNNTFFSWEEAVEWLIQQPDQQELVKACYYDRPLYAAAERFFQSCEWIEIRRFFYTELKGKALDVGAGNGIASYALAKDGWETTALEPDSSTKVGAGAIRELANLSGVHINVVEEFGEELPFRDQEFNLIHARQVFHHANDLPQFCGELYRVTKPGGLLLATREPVISSARQLNHFLERHPLHQLYGGENAFTRQEYQNALVSAGFKLEKVLGPFDSVINYSPPFTDESLRDELEKRLCNVPMGKFVAPFVLHPRLFITSLRILSLLDRRPGRLFTFIARKPRISQ